MHTSCIPDVGRAAVWLHPEQVLEIHRLALGFQFLSALLRRVQECLLRRWHAPASHDDLSSTRSIADDRGWEVREDARHARQVADTAVERAEQATDRVYTLRHRVEIAHDQVSGGAWRGRGLSCRRVAAGRRPPLAQLLQRSRLA